MIRVYVDTSDVHALTARAEVELQAAPREMLDVLMEEAEIARSSHAYQNRTHVLEDTTFAAPTPAGGDEVAVELTARAEYASFVQDRGYTTGVPEAAERADKRIDQLFQAKVRRIAG